MLLRVDFEYNKYLLALHINMLIIMYLKAEARFTGQVDWARVYEGVSNPTNVAIHQGQRFVNYASATIGWFLIALLYNGPTWANKREVNFKSNNMLL